MTEPIKGVIFTSAKNVKAIVHRLFAHILLDLRISKSKIFNAEIFKVPTIKKIFHNFKAAANLTKLMQNMHPLRKK